MICPIITFAVPRADESRGRGHLGRHHRTLAPRGAGPQGRAMRILHLENQAGVANQLAQAQRRLGHDAMVMETWYNTLDEPHDVEMYYTHDSFTSDARNAMEIVKYARDFDIVHIHGGMFWKRADAVAIKLLLRKPLVVHYHGSETRDGYGMHYRFLADHKFVSRPDLLKWHPDSQYVPNPVGQFSYEFDAGAKLRVLHMATNRRAKGTDTIEKTLEAMVRGGAGIEYAVLDRVPHSQAMGELRRSHILIDQLIDPRAVGMPSIIGVASFEAMAMGKVAISSFDREYRPYYPGCPVVAIEPTAEALEEAILRFRDDMASAQQIGMAGRQYVREKHSADTIVKDVMPVYEGLLEKRARGPAIPPGGWTSGRRSRSGRS